MLHLLGRKARGPTDLVDALSECHGRVRHFASLAVSLGQRADTPVAELVHACAWVERYFSEAMPVHVRDEEESVVPRLLGRSSALDAAIARMREQHELHDTIISRVCAASRALRADPKNARMRSLLLATAQPLAVFLEDHLRAEEETIFPALRDLLSAEERETIRREIRARRTAIA